MCGNIELDDVKNPISSITDSIANSTTPTINFTTYYHGHMANTVVFSAFFLLTFLIRMAISTSIETLIAIPFKIRPLWKIVIVNIITQILLFSLLAFGGLGYINAEIIGEIFVFISEFAVYDILLTVEAVGNAKQ